MLTDGDLALCTMFLLEHGLKNYQTTRAARNSAALAHKVHHFTCGVKKKNKAFGCVRHIRTQTRKGLSSPFKAHNEPGAYYTVPAELTQCSVVLAGVGFAWRRMKKLNRDQDLFRFLAGRRIENCNFLDHGVFWCPRTVQLSLLKDNAFDCWNYET
jgi:hypothetical protein